MGVQLWRFVLRAKLGPWYFAPQVQLLIGIARALAFMFVCLELALVTGLRRQHSLIALARPWSCGAEAFSKRGPVLNPRTRRQLWLREGSDLWIRLSTTNGYSPIVFDRSRSHFLTYACSRNFLNIKLYQTWSDATRMILYEHLVLWQE